MVIEVLKCSAMKRELFSGKKEQSLYLYAIIEQVCSLLSYKYRRLFFLMVHLLFYILLVSYGSLLACEVWILCLYLIFCYKFIKVCCSIKVMFIDLFCYYFTEV